MAKEIIKIVLTEKDIKDLVSEKWNLDSDTSNIQVYHYKGDPRESSYTTITVEGTRNDK
jgi:hypothetical protein